jgi:hypothetical protein
MDFGGILLDAASMGGWAILHYLRNELRGYYRFKEATRIWPLWSIIAGITSIPLLFAAGIARQADVSRALRSTSTFKARQELEELIR